MVSFTGVRARQPSVVAPARTGMGVGELGESRRPHVEGKVPAPEAVDREDRVAGLERPGRRRVGRHAAHLELRRLGGDERGSEEDQEGDDEVHGRPREDHHDPLPDRLVVVAARSDLRGEVLLGVHPGDLRVAAQGDGADAVLGLTALDLDDLGAEEERELLDAHAGRLGREEVPQLVQDHEGEDAGEGEGPAQGATPTRPAIASRASSRASESAA